MANKPFEYTIINPLERPTSTDINQLQAQAHYDLRQFAYEIFGRQNGFLGYSFNPEPNSPADGTFYIQQGVAFQFGAAENTFGTPPIPGLVDSYQQKAVTTINRQITAEPVPAGAGEKRYDLLMIRAPSGDERLKNPQSVGIFNPTLGSFPAAVEKYKTLTSSLTEFDVEPISSTGTPTSPIVYKSGNVFTGAWDPVNKPAVDVGYLGVAYIRRYEGQAAIEAADIEDARTLLAVPAQSGGSGVSSVGDAGAIAYSNGTNLEFIRASVFGVPQTGRILVSGGASAPTWLVSASASSLLVSGGINVNPTWLTPGVDGDVVISNGTSWQSQSASRFYSASQTGGVYSNDTETYSDVPGLVLTDIALRRGNVRVELQPTVNNTTDYTARIQNTAGGRRGYILVEMQNGPLTIDRVFPYELDPNTTGSLALPSFTASLAAGGSWTVTVSARSGNAGDTTIFIQNCDLVVTQG